MSPAILKWLQQHNGRLSVSAKAPPGMHPMEPGEFFLACTVDVAGEPFDIRYRMTLEALSDEPGLLEFLQRRVEQGMRSRGVTE